MRVFPQQTAHALLQMGGSLALNVAIRSQLVGAIPLIVAVAASTVALAILAPSESSLFYSLYSFSRFSLIHLVGGITVVPFVHECGHALVALALFKRAHPVISYLGPFKGAYTTYCVSYGLTKLGNYFGKEACIALTSAGGLLATSVWSLAIGKVSRSLALSQIFHEASYCLEALNGCHDLAQDYSRLWVEHDIHPLYPLAWMGILTSVQLSV